MNVKIHRRNREKKNNESTSNPTEKQENPIYSELDKNVFELKKTYSSEVNKDFVCRQFTIRASNKKAAMFYLGSVVNATKISDGIIRPLVESEGDTIESIVTIENVSEIQDMVDATEQINIGNAVLLIEGEKGGYSFGVADFKHRGIEKAENESLIKGPKEAFTESAAINLSLLRKRIHDEHLIAEGMPIGKRSKVEVTIMYLNDVANPQVLENLKDRLKKLNTDSVRNVEQLEQYIEDRPRSLIPTILYTERPDRAAAFLEDGYIVLLMDNSSSCLILPVTFWSFFHSAEDHYLRFMYGNFERMIRAAAFFITLFISAAFLAITNYHSEMLPPDLLLAIASARERVPFPSIFEVLIMEFAFELIREAGLRIPSPLGPTIGIVGALILGQAAVQGNIVSPIIIIITAMSGLSSFAVSDVSFNYTLRITRFIFILGAAMYGMFGLSIAFLLWLNYMVSVKSFGVPFLAPMSPRYKSSEDTIFRKILQKEENRPGFLLPKDMKKKKMR